jgi:Cu2+-containing amine oxidase
LQKQQQLDQNAAARRRYSSEPLSVLHQQALRCFSSASSSSGSIHPLDPLTGDEISQTSEAVRKFLGLSPANTVQHLRFVSISLCEPPKKDYVAGIKTPRSAEVVALNPHTGVASEYTVDLEANRVVDSKDLPKGVQPLLTPEVCITWMMNVCDHT